MPKITGHPPFNGCCYARCNIEKRTCCTRGVRSGLDHEAGTLTVTMPMRPELERRLGGGQFHGGPIAAFIDTVGDYAIGMAVGGGVPTINLRIDYLRPAVGSVLTGTARVRRAGRTVAVVDVEVHDEQQALVAVGRGTYSGQRG